MREELQQYDALRQTLASAADEAAQGARTPERQAALRAAAGEVRQATEAAGARLRTRLSADGAARLERQLQQDKATLRQLAAAP